MDRALERLREEFTVLGHRERFDQLQPWLLGDKTDLTYAALATVWQTTEAAIKMTVSRMRRRYRELFLQEIAQGGMGVVYRACQRNLGRLVALKMIRAGHLARREEVRRFHQEAAAAATLQHPSIVAVHEAGEVDGQHSYSMDLVEGRSLAEIVHQHPLSPRQAAVYLKGIPAGAHGAIERAQLRVAPVP